MSAAGLGSVVFPLKAPAMFLRFRATALVLLAFTTPASAAPWFLHHFGELRSYHGDWLDVCDDAGRGPCRAVQVLLRKDGDTFFGESRLTLRVVDGGFMIEVYDAGLPDGIGDILNFDFGTKQVAVTRRQWKLGETAYDNVAETFTVTDPALTAQLIDLIRAGRWLTVRYDMPDGTEGTAKFSLRGSTDALDALARQVATQG